MLIFFKFFLCVSYLLCYRQVYPTSAIAGVSLLPSSSSSSDCNLANYLYFYNTDQQNVPGIGMFSQHCTLHYSWRSRTEAGEEDALLVAVGDPGIAHRTTLMIDRAEQS